MAHQCRRSPRPALDNSRRCESIPAETSSAKII
jgi:hypothetical protein